jgi:YrbI family 3-deoxy-D-manno-octulosonate 8-phosphate phosphatase
MKDLINKAKKIKLIGTDIDGVWTDARMYVTPKGEWMKAFSTYDGMATAMLKEKGYILAILTSENSDIVLQRAKKLNIDEVYINEHEKLKRMKYLAEKYDITLDEIAYIGDDINDLPLLKSVGLSALSGNSPIINKFKPDYVTNRHGGDGAYREFIEIILNA